MPYLLLYVTRIQVVLVPLLPLQQMGTQPVIDLLMPLYYLAAGMLSEHRLLRSTLDLGLTKVIVDSLMVSELFSELQLYVSYAL